MPFKARASKASPSFFFLTYVKTKRQSCCVTHQRGENIVKETLSEQNDRRFNYFRTNCITAVFGNPREIFLFNYSIQFIRAMVTAFAD